MACGNVQSRAYEIGSERGQLRCRMLRRDERLYCSYLISWTGAASGRRGLTPTLQQSEGCSRCAWSTWHVQLAAFIRCSVCTTESHREEAFCRWPLQVMLAALDHVLCMQHRYVHGAQHSAATHQGLPGGQASANHSCALCCSVSKPCACMQVCAREGQDSMVLSILLRHIRSLPQGAPQQTMLLREAARQAQALPSSFAIPALVSALQVFDSPGSRHFR